MFNCSNLGLSDCHTFLSVLALRMRWFYILVEIFLENFSIALCLSVHVVFKGDFINFWTFFLIIFGYFKVVELLPPSLIVYNLIFSATVMWNIFWC